MLATRLFRLVREQRLSVPLVNRFLHPELVNEHDNTSSKNQADKKATAGITKKYKEFRDDDSVEIFDVDEERHRYAIADQVLIEADERFHGLNMKRGIHGVFDLEDLVDVLRKENVEKLFVSQVPPENKYVDYMVVCSGRSYRHMFSTAEFIRLLYKRKRNPEDELPRIEGEKSKDWMALDLGNIALHIFSTEARELYDLESLWAIGSKYDRESNKKLNPYADMFMPRFQC